VNRQMHLVVSVPLILSVAGCAHTKVAPTTSIRINPSSLASSPPIVPDAQWRARIPLGAKPQADHICKLCDQYELIEIRTPRRWLAFSEQTGLQPGGTTPDFSRGIVVGLVARVGEPADGAWPTSISEVRLQDDGGAWLRSRFRTGLYRPLLVDDYCNLVYIKGLKHVILVEVNRRAFLTAQ